MGVKVGYKQTEVGVIPEEWEVRTLSEVSRKITDGDHVTPIRTSHGYFLLSARNVLNGRIDVSDVDYVGLAEYQRMKQRCGPEAGDILISCSGTVGRVTVVPVGFECVLVRSAALAKIDPELADGIFLQFWLQGSKAQSQIASSVNQGAQPNLFLNHIERLVCPQPPLPEQRVIATALSDVDVLLGVLDRLITKKRDLKQAAMQQLLTGQTRLPGFHGKWQVKQLGDVAVMSKGTGLSKSTISVSGTRKCILYGELFTTYDRVIDHVINRTNSLDGRPSQAGDVLVPGSTTTSGIDLATASALFEDDVALGGDINIIRCRSKGAFEAAFLARYLTCVKKKEIAERAQGTTIIHLYGRDLLDITLALPAISEQTAISKVLGDLDSELAGLEQRRDKTRDLKQAMMQELLTGRTRLV